MKHAAAALVLLLLLAPPRGAFAANAPVQNSSVKTELYFGLSKPDGGTVSAAEWTDFLDNTISPSFKDGLTVVDADGRYADKSGTKHAERSKLVILIHAPRPELNAAIDAVIAKYKERFKQESVLRVTTSVIVGSPTQLLSEYSAFNNSERLNSPADYIAYLKTSRFKNGELDNLPKIAIILHTSKPEEFIAACGDTLVNSIETGTASPNRLDIVQRKAGGRYLVNRGLPGAGGIAAQTAELGALGVKTVIHIGTCAALSGDADEKWILVSTGSYKDGAAVMLSPKEKNAIQPISRPDADLSGMLAKEINEHKLTVYEALGYTIPIYYDQPSGLIVDLFTAEKYPDGRANYIEMEEASFFESARRGGMKAASLTVPSDRYLLRGGKLAHEFTGDTGPGLRDAFKTAVEILERLEKK